MKLIILAGAVCLLGALWLSYLLTLSVAENKPSDVWVVGWLSEVAFVSSEGPKGEPFRVWLNRMLDDGRAEIWCVNMETRYTCTVSAWFGYLRDVLKPLAPELIALWQGNGGDLDLRFKTASVLALIAPRTQGLVRLLQDAIESKQNYTAIFFLGEIGPLAAPAAASLETLAGDPGVDAEIRTAATEALRKIRG